MQDTVMTQLWLPLLHTTHLR